MFVEFCLVTIITLESLFFVHSKSKSPKLICACGEKLTYLPTKTKAIGSNPTRTFFVNGKR